MTTKVLTDIPVWSVSTIGVKSSGKAFSLLESKFDSLKGRKFYGLLYGNADTGTYRACALDDGYKLKDTQKLKKWIIPGGKYATEKIIEWTKHTNLIAEVFKQLSHSNDIDSSRPQIEFYKSQKELIVMIPIL